MRSKSLQSITAVFLIMLLLMAPACLGPNHATARLGNWNVTEFEGKWAQEGMFLVLFIPYVLFSVGDMLIFNPIQWWTGENPIVRPDQLAKVSL